jgi:glycosyltransferase involved in cell wall biosynthesis
MRRAPSVISLDATPANMDEMAAGYSHHQAGKLAERLKRAAMVTTLRRATYLMPWSDWCARSLIADYGVDPQRARVVRPGVGTTAWAPRPVGPREPLRALFVGGDFERKGGPDLLQALGQLRGDWECDIVTKSEVPTFASSARARVHRDLGPGDDRLAQLYANADVFVLPTRGDASPWAVMEAMAAGLPVVSCAVGAVGELVQDGTTGVLVAPGDVPGLAAALQHLLDDPAARRRMAQAAYKRATEELDEDQNGAKILQLVKLAASQGARR